MPASPRCGGQFDAAGVVVLDDFLSVEGHALLKEQILEREQTATGERG
jgi:hypothetical protein